MRGSQCFSHQLTVCLFGNSPQKIDVAFDGTWLTCEHIIEMYICWSCWTYHRYVLRHISVRCIVAVYSGLVVDHVLLSNFCLVGSIGLKPHEEGYADWLTTHTPVGQKDDCKARQMKVEAAFDGVPMSSGEAQAAIHRHSVRWGQQYVSRSGRRRCVRIAKTPEDCMNHVCQVGGRCLACSCGQFSSPGQSTWRQGKAHPRLDQRNRKLLPPEGPRASRAGHAASSWGRPAAHGVV